MLPLNEEVNIDKCRTSLKNALQLLHQDDNGQASNIKQLLFIQNGIDGLKANPKDLVKKIFDQCGQYYAAKKRDTKVL
mgnify:CR=1 FL=1